MEENKTEFVKLTENDIPDCVQIYFSAFKILEQIRPFYNAARYFGKYISDDDKFAYGLKCDDKLVGIMVAIQLPAFFSDYTIYIDVVAIQPDYQHRGLGTKMMNSFFESVSGKSATSLNTYKNSEPYKFYQQFRFKDDEIVHMEREYIDVNELIKRLENEVANLREKNSTQPSE